jgi:conjugal transfer pilus assembly protein TraF
MQPIGRILLPVLLTVASATPAQPPAGAMHTQSDGSPTAYWADRWRGWHFYEAPLPETDEPTQMSRGPQLPAPPGRQAELIAFEQLQKAVEDTRNIAIMRPTEANVRRYMELEMQVVGRASYFADVAQRVAWATPSLDPTLHGRPVNATALQVFEHQQQADRSSTVATLGQDHVLLFFYRSDCPYCHAFAPILKAFEAGHGIQVVAISLDGGMLPGFPNARQDNGIATALQVNQVPAVFLAQPASGTITPIGFGVLSESQLLERIAIVASPQTQAMLPGTARQLALP